MASSALTKRRRTGDTAVTAVYTEMRSLDLVGDAAQAEGALVTGGLKLFIGSDGLGSSERIGEDMNQGVAQQLSAVGHSEAAESRGYGRVIGLGALRFTADLIFWDHEAEKWFKLRGRVRVALPRPRPHAPRPLPRPA
jgi:hypothetical protein